LIVTGLDTETTGLSQEKGHRFVEISAMVYETLDGSNFKRKLKPYCQRINPMRSIDKKAEAVHGIPLSDLKNEPLWEDVAPKILKVMNMSDVVVCHNANFDIPFIIKELLRVNLTLTSDPEIFCTMVSGRLVTAMGKMPNLGELCEAFDVDYDPDSAHSADYDTQVMMDSFIKGIQTDFFKLESINTLRG